MIILKLTEGPLNIGQIVDEFDVSRQAIAKHIKILSECGMIKMTQKVREQVCEARIEQLGEVEAWVSKSRTFESIAQQTKVILHQSVSEEEAKNGGLSELDLEGSCLSMAAIP